MQRISDKSVVLETTVINSNFIYGADFTYLLNATAVAAAAAEMKRSTKIALHLIFGNFEARR